MAKSESIDRDILEAARSLLSEGERDFTMLSPVRFSDCYTASPYY